jgi:hypothetical protein
VEGPIANESVGVCGLEGDQVVFEFSGCSGGVVGCVAWEMVQGTGSS